MISKLLKESSLWVKIVAPMLFPVKQDLSLILLITDHFISNYNELDQIFKFRK